MYLKINSQEAWTNTIFNPKIHKHPLFFFFLYNKDFTVPFYFNLVEKFNLDYLY